MPRDVIPDPDPDPDADADVDLDALLAEIDREPVDLDGLLAEMERDRRRGLERALEAID